MGESNRYLDIPELVGYPYEWAWGIHPTDDMFIVVYHWSKPVMKMFLGEAIEQSSRRRVLQHIKACDNSSWITKWQSELKEETWNALTKDYASS